MTTKQESKRLKDAATMTAGVTPNKLEIGATIDLHGHPATITHTDAADTMVQYANKARRTFDTHVLNSFLDLKTFPVDAAFERPTAPVERAVIEAVTGDCCYQVRMTIGSEEPFHITFTYADFVAWHMENSSRAGETRVSSIPTALINPSVDDKPEADEPDETTNPFEEDLQKEVERLRKENFDLKADLLRQHDLHVTEILVKDERIARLEEKAAILNPAPTRKEVCTLAQKIGLPAEREKADQELADKLNADWKTLNITVISNPDELTMRYVMLVRDLPAEQPKLEMPALKAAAFLHIGGLPLGQYPPVQPPPMPANQTIIHQPVGRALTNNVNRDPGATKRIPTLADIEARRERDNAEIAGIMERGRDAQEVLRRRFAQTPRSFNRIGAQ